ncbi:MAG: hypothetical protein EOO96_16840 [Pedobacter sp.]|nr:MAG: hypothetical protein EOO96_16840 [Pedobacter sp.]
MKTFLSNAFSFTSSPLTAINCSQEDSYDLYAQCILRDDLTSKLRITFIALFIINCALLAKNIYNLVVIHRLKRTKNLKHMAIFNALLLPTILLHMALYANSILLELGLPGYSLMVYGIIEIVQVIALNNLFALGAYFWMKMLFRLTFNNKISINCHLQNRGVYLHF